jgi:hypothetical protein
MAVIQKEQGGTRERFGSGGCAILDSGASLHGFGHVQIESAACLNINDGASMAIKPTATTHQNAYVLFNAGANQFWYAVSSTCPTFSASPGDVLWLAQSLSTSFWVNASDGTAGSVWRGLGGLGSPVSYVK